MYNILVSTSQTLGTTHAYTKGLGSKLGMLVSFPDLHAHTEGLGMRLCKYICVCVCVRLVITSKLEFQALQLQ